jgi:hypothetical protein
LSNSFYLRFSGLESSLVIRYDYLWTREAAVGRRDQERSAQPCLVAALDPAASPRFVVILPDHARVAGKGTVGVEIPAKVREVLGLDAID